MSNWSDLFCKEKESYICVEITGAEEKMLSDVAHRMESKKDTEFAYIQDGSGIGTRWLTGLAGEYAVSKQLLNWGLIDEMPSFDLELGLSSTYDTADLIRLGFNLGCKTAGINRPLLVKENETYAEVISVYDKTQGKVYICGIATPDILKKYADESLVLESNVRKKAGSVAAKVGFNRFDKLIPFTKENLKRFRADLEVEYLRYFPKERKDNAKGLTTYMEVADGKLHIKSWNNSFSIDEIAFDYPLSHSDLKKMTRILNPNRIYIGFRVAPIIEKLQSDWVGEPLKIKVLDMSDILSERNEQYYKICHDLPTSEAISNLTMLLKPVAIRPMDYVTANYYMFLWTLCK